MFTMTMQKFDDLGIDIGRRDLVDFLEDYGRTTKRGHEVRITLKLITELYRRYKDEDIHDFIHSTLKKSVARRICIMIENLFSVIVASDAGSPKEIAAERKAARIVYEALKNDNNWTKKALSICKGK